VVMEADFLVAEAIVAEAAPVAAGEERTHENTPFLECR